MKDTRISYKNTKLACYTAYFTISSIFSLPPILFVTFREMYGISYTLLGTLVLVNFITQLSIDLIFSFFSKYFNPKILVKTMPIITAFGMVLYALIPTFFQNIAYWGLLLGTVIFSVAAGLSEVLLSPVIAAIPSENPQRDMSFLHSLYAFGVFSVVVVSTVFLKLFGNENWMYLTLFFAFLPLIAAVMFMRSPLPDMQKTDGSANNDGRRKKNLGLFLCVGCIFFGSCAENTMANWISSYMENALHIDKAVGDILGMAMFAILLGIARILYARFGKNIENVLLVGMAGAAICYLITGFSTNTVLAFIACIFVGLFTAMLWPGALIMMEERILGASVAAYALMAAGGDLGASFAPQLMGIVIDKVSASDFALQIGNSLSLSAEQIGLKIGMVISAIFPIIGVGLLVITIRYFKKNGKKI